MKTLRSISIFSIILLLLSFQEHEYCSCGSPESGIITWDILGEGNGCCSGEPGWFGEVSYFTPSENGWKLIHTEEISSSDAQATCCNDNNT